MSSAWNNLIGIEAQKPYFAELKQYVRERYASTTVYPPAPEVFNAFRYTTPDQIKVVILGQDPYHGPGQANGLAFSVNDGIDIPPSLKNIFKEIETDTGDKPFKSGDLSRWARQGVLLLNATLTVEEHNPGSHQGKGWEQFTDAVVEALNANFNNLVFMLWGSYAIKKGSIVDTARHLVLTSPHPSPLSAHRGFFGNHHFTKANQYLSDHGKTPVDWR